MLAVGAYEHTILPRDFKSVFIFARLDGPLLTLEFAELKGVKVGFGYNYSLKLPSVANILDFPLVASLSADANSDPLQTLRKFDLWVAPQENSLWLAAGFTLDAFQILTIEATAIFTFSPVLGIAIVGLATASMPPNVKVDEHPFVYVELGIVGALDIAGGSLRVEAQLTQNSFILNPSCHLTGGFAICYWFQGSPYVGDWMFSVGGFHPSFLIPEHYSNPPRVGISWNLSDVLRIEGEAYFAVTPKVCMGGGRYSALFSAGPIEAHFEAWANFLVNFRPFFFMADIGVCVGVAFVLDIGIITIRIGAEISAMLFLQGPPFRGVVYVDLWVHNFSVSFGEDPGPPPPVDFKQFLELVKQPGPADAQEKASESFLVVELITGSATEKIESSKRIPGDRWIVRAGSFSFRVESKFAVKNALLRNGVKSDLANRTPIYARPMQLINELDTSCLNVEITYHDGDNDSNWQKTLIMRNVPTALWGKYVHDEDPLAAGSNVNSNGNLLSHQEGTVSHAAGLTVTNPKALLPKINIPAYDAIASQESSIFPFGSDPTLLPNGPQQHRWLPQPQPANPWDNIELKWNSVDMGPAQLLADNWTTAFGWDKGPIDPGKVAGTENTYPVPLFTWLEAKKPDILLEDFKQHYLGAPWVATPEVPIASAA
ncbi:hypothetical protein K440DRAFT_593079 [Wilcoxina mikolae CBS 423.85]|nr:hypothetical protein K440DRAFT_593079 [Wilcoxina mikolae CBS 423.85]